MSQLRNAIIANLKKETPYVVLPYCYFNDSPVQTDILVKSTWTKVDISLSSTGATNNTFLFGCRSGSSGTDKIQIQNNNNYSRYAFTFGSNTAVYCTIDDLTTRTDFEITGTTVTYTYEGVTDNKSVGSDTGFKDCPYPICIGGLQNASAIATAKMTGYFWSLKVYDNNILVNDIIPVKDSNNVVCLYDLKTDKYYYPIEGTVLLEEAPPPVPVDDGIFKFTVDMQHNPTLNCYLTISGASDYTVDWGDGTSVQTGQSMHTYSVSGQYQIKVTKGTNFPSLKLSNMAEVISIDTPLPYMNSVTDLSSFAISCANLTTINENLFYFNSQITNLNSAFLGCTSISTLPSKLLTPLTNLLTINSGFQKNTSLTSIPTGFFDTNTSLTRVWKTFYNCTSLETIPDLLFDKNSALYDFNQCFYGCTKLTIPTNLFCNDSTDKTTRFASVSGTDFDSCFYRTSYTGTTTMTVPALWDYTFTGTPSRWGCYGGAGNSSTNITNYSSIPNPWNAS